MHLQPDIPFSEYQNQSERDVFVVVEPIALKIEAGEIDSARDMLARLTLWFLEQIKQKKLEPYKARNSYFLLYVYLTDNYPGEIMGEQAHQLIYEGTMLHLYGEEDGPDIGFMREAAWSILDAAATEEAND